MWKFVFGVAVVSCSTPAAVRSPAPATTVAAPASPAATVAGGAAVTPTPAVSERPASADRISFVDGEGFDETDLSVARLQEALGDAPIAALHACYTEVLKRDFSARGKVSIQFTVQPSGRLDQVKVRGFDEVMDRCVAAGASAIFADMALLPHLCGQVG